MLIKPGTPIYNHLDPPLDKNQRPAQGTIGGVVYQGSIRLLLTCYHCVISKHLDYRQFVAGNGNDKADTIIQGDIVPLGTIIKAQRDPKTDIALIAAGPRYDLQTDIPGIHAVSGSRTLTKEDSGKVRLRKYGLTTGLTTGDFAGIASGGCVFPLDGNQKFFIDELLLISGGTRKFSDDGDSGAFVVDDQNAVVGIVVMTDGNNTYAIPVAAIINAFGIAFTPQPPNSLSV